MHDASVPSTDYGNPAVDRVLDACAGFSVQDFAELAVAAADQAGLSVAEQVRLAKALATVVERCKAAS